jgi:hypothetical protein
MRRLAFLAIIVLGAAPPLHAPQAANALQMQQAWAILDQCRKESFTKFPDQTEEGQQQRDRYVRECKARRGNGQAATLGRD